MKFLLDNGAYTIKHGFEDSTPIQVFNCISSCKRDLQVAPKSLQSTTEVLRPIERGILVDPELQLKIWRSILPSDLECLIYTCPIFTPYTSRHSYDELIFEDLQISSASRVSTGINEQCLLLVDIGFSCITVTPIVSGLPVNYAVTRCNVGGKLITNFMKEQISYRSYDMTEETWLVSHIREQACYVSLNFIKELRDLQHKRTKEVIFALPEGKDSGFIVKDQSEAASRQLMNLSNLVITVPELIFRPSDAGIQCGGVHEGIIESIQKLNKETAQDLLKNIWICGGLAKTPGLLERLRLELRQMVDCDVRVFRVNDEVMDCWENLKNVENIVTKKDYEELGSYYIDSLFHYT